MAAKPRKFPEYDPETDGNVFEWILDQADELHRRQTVDARMPHKKVDYLRTLAEGQAKPSR